MLKTNTPPVHQDEGKADIKTNRKEEERYEEKWKSKITLKKADERDKR